MSYGEVLVWSPFIKGDFSLLLKPIYLLWGLFLGAIFIIYTMIISFVLVVMALFMNDKTFFHKFISVVWGRSLLFMCSVRHEARGLEHLKGNQGGLLLFNHASNFDIVALVASFPQLNFGAKAELFRVPFLSRGMKLLGALPIYRKKRFKVLQIYKEAESRMKDGEYFALAPEGMRVDNDSIQPFRSGPFLFAVGAGGDIYPTVIAGARQVMKKNSPFVNPGRLGGRIIVEILPPHSTKGLSQEDIKTLKKQIFEKMNDKHILLRKEMGIN